ncbi:MAG: glycosyltransferase family 4 protein [Chthonomonadales bacterium]|nr:glycosyltransferase family 4 protein [Chthonomonadales bacterium]
MRTVREFRPDWLILQYCAFAYGRWGLNPYLPLAIRRVMRACPDTRFALMVHEPLAWPINWKLRLMNVWQRWQLRELGRTADVVFFSIDPWVRQFGPWFPGTPAYHLPVGSNVPRVEITREEARRRLSIPGERVVLGLFGTAHHSRLFGLAGEAVGRLRSRGIDAGVLYIGPHGDRVRAAMGDVPSICEGPLPADEVSRRFSAMDIYLAPFADGVSTRRTSLMTGLQHGCAVAATRGPLTDDVLLKEDGRAFLLSDVSDQDGFTANVVRLAEDADLRAALGSGARALHATEFAWERIAGRMLKLLRRYSGRATAGEAESCRRTGGR